MRQRFFAVASATMMLGLSLAGPVFAGEPIEGVDVKLGLNPGGSITAVGHAVFTGGKGGAPTNANITLNVTNYPNSIITATFPEGYTVTAAATSGLSSPCLSAFGFTASTLTATETNCAGNVTLGGAVVNLPPTATPVLSTSAETGQNDSNAKLDTKASDTQAASDLRQCKANATKAHTAAIKSITTTRQTVLQAARKNYLDAIKAAQQAYTAAKTRIAADAKASKATADGAWTASGPQCSAINTTRSNIKHPSSK